MKYGVVMDQQGSSGMMSLSQKIGRLAITSGVTGLVAFVFLIIAVTTRGTWTLSSRVYLLFRAHDLAVVLQLLLLIPVAHRLQKLSGQNPPDIGRKTEMPRSNHAPMRIEFRLPILQLLIYAAVASHVKSI